jgi:hypothetical protein
MTIPKINPLGIRLEGRVVASGASTPSEPPPAGKRERDLRAAKDSASAPGDADALKARARVLIEQARLTVRRPSGDGGK